MKVLFWNLNRKPLSAMLRQLAEDHLPDVLALAECEISDVELLETLNEGRHPKYRLTTVPTPRLRFLTLLPEGSLLPVSDTGTISIRGIHPPVGIDIILVVVHLGSKLYQSEHDQALSCTRLAREIRDAEQRVGHRRTVVVGDFNMDPFEYGVVGAEGLHAVSSRRVAKRGFRVVDGEERTFFYNPMWSRLGDGSVGPPGTYFYSGSAQVTYFWHAFDQVLVRPDLLERFSDTSLNVITSVGAVSLLDGEGRPNSRIASDHLPVTFALNLL